VNQDRRPGPPLLAFIGFAVAVIGLALALIVTMGSLQRVRREFWRYIVVIDSLHREVAALKDSIAQTTVRGRSDARLLAKLRDGLRPDEIEDLRAQGLTDPVREIKADLMRHPELIPIPGVLGGRMGFYSEDGIRILDEHWVYAEFDDGHIGGATLLTYDVKGGRIRWTRFAARRL
jgi:hypothetical protein